MLLTSEIEGFRGSHLATCLIFEVGIYRLLGNHSCRQRIYL